MTGDNLKLFVKLVNHNYYSAYAAYLENGWTENESGYKAYREVRNYVFALEFESGKNWSELRELLK